MRESPTVALAVAAVLVLLSVMVVVPPYSMALFPVVVGATELSPLLALLDLLWCAAAIRMLRRHPRFRVVTALLLLAAAVVAIRPLVQFATAAASARDQLERGAARSDVSFFAALRRLPAAGHVLQRAIAYSAADGSPLTMRLYALPEHAIRPTVVVIYGGAWRSGDPSQGENVSRALAARGYTVAAIDYRHAPRFQFPAQLDDLRRSLALLRDSAASWGIDPSRMALLGRSAGGHLAELAAFAPGAPPVRAVVALYAPHDLVQGYRDLPSPDPIGVRAVLRGFVGGTPDDHLAGYQAASPSSYVRAGLPPTLLLFGGKDHIVKPSFNRAAAASLRAAHVPVVAVELPWAEHGFDMAPGGLGGRLAFAVIAEFLDRALTRPTAPPRPSGAP